MATMIHKEDNNSITSIHLYPAAAVAIDTSDAGTNTISAGANTVSASIGEDTASAALLSSAAATLCLDCRGPDGLCYNPDPGSCSNFLQCSRATTTTTASVTWTHNVLPCQSGTFWSQESLTCVHPEDSSCLRRKSLVVLILLLFFSLFLVFLFFFIVPFLLFLFVLCCCCCFLFSMLFC